MGDLGDSLTGPKRPKEYHVLVTGAGPFMGLTNPSNIIAGRLPSRISLPAHPASTTSDLEIAVYATPEPWSVSYPWVNEQFPPMLFPPAPKSSSDLSTVQATKSSPNYDFTLVIGMANGRDYYTFETQAFRDHYNMPDINGVTAEKDDRWKRQGAPEVLTTSFRTDRVYGYWRDNVPEEIDVQPSKDPGRYLCGYIYYTGLFEYWLRADKNLASERPVVFLHVPGEYDDATIEKGAIVALNLIKAMAIDIHESRESKT